MTRFLCFPLLFVIAFPVFAQEELPVQGRSLPSNPALLARTRDQIIMEYQQTNRMLGLVNPNDTHTVEALKAQQVELTKQLRDITQEMQAGNQLPALPGIGEGQGLPPGLSLPTYTTHTPMPPTMRTPDLRAMDMPPVMPGNPYQQLPNSVLPNRLDMPPSPMSPPYQQMPYNPTPPVPAAPNWVDQDRTWDLAWGPRLPKEMTEVKQSVDALKKEVADLKETIKALETQIQLLNRNILLSDRAKENGN
jgi:hypothetical protein